MRQRYEHLSGIIQAVQAHNYLSFSLMLVKVFTLKTVIINVSRLFSTLTLIINQTIFAPVPSKCKCKLGLSYVNELIVLS